MKRREKILAILLVIGAVATLGRSWFYGIFFTGLDDAWSKIHSQQKRADTLDDQELQLLATKRRLAEWQARSLPPDPAVAQRLYREWLTDLAQFAGFAPSTLHVIPQQSQLTANPAYKAVRVSVKAESTFEQLAAFLREFERADLLHRIAALNVESSAIPGGLFKITVDAEGLCLNDAAPRMRLFPRTQLADALARSFDTLKVVSSEGFPKEPGFDIRIGTEFLKVTKISGNEWTTTRAQEGTTKARHEKKADVDLFPIRSDRNGVNFEEQKKTLAVHPFTRPIPPRAADPNDPARQTRLMASIDSGSDRAAYLYNKSTKSKTEVRKGTSISVGDIQGVVVSVEPNFVQIQRGAEVWELDIGQDLRSMRRVERGSDDMSFPE